LADRLCSESFFVCNDLLLNYNSTHILQWLTRYPGTLYIDTYTIIGTADCRLPTFFWADYLLFGGMGTSKTLTTLVYILSTKSREVTTDVLYWIEIFFEQDMVTVSNWYYINIIVHDTLTLERLHKQLNLKMFLSFYYIYYIYVYFL